METKSANRSERIRKLWNGWVESVQSVPGVDLCVFSNHSGKIYGQSKSSAFESSDVQCVMGAFNSGGVGKVKLLSREFKIINNSGREKKEETKDCNILLLKRLADDAIPGTPRKSITIPGLAIKTDCLVLLVIGKPGVNPNMLCAVEPFMQKLSNDLMKKLLD